MKRMLFPLSAILIFLTGCTGKPDITDIEKPQVHVAELTGETQNPETDVTVDDDVNNLDDDDNKVDDSDIDDDKDNETDVVDVADAQTMNNNSRMVYCDGKVFFMSPGEDMMDESGLFGEYGLYSYNNAGTFVGYNVADDELDFWFRSESFGDFIISGDYFYVCSVQDDDNTVLKLDYNTGEVVDRLEGRGLSAVSEDGRYIVTNVFVQDAGDMLYLYEDGNLLKKLENFPVYDSVGFGGDYFYYITYSEGYDKQYLYSLNIETLEEVELGTFEYPDDSVWGGEIEQVYFEGDDLYLGFGYYEGTGHFFYKGYFCTAKGGVEDSLQSFEVGPTEDDYAMPAFVVSDKSMIECDGEPGTAAVNEMGYICYYNESGYEVPVANEYGEFGTIYLDEDYEKRINIEYLYLIDNAIFGVRNEEHHDSANDVGWRTAYVRDKVEFFMVDISTGEETIIMTVE